MRIQLSDHFHYRKLLRFTLPSIIMMLFTSVYGLVDALFISNFVGITPFAAINLILPLTMILGAVGFMFGAGGSALVSATLGAKDAPRANRIFSMLTYIALGLGIALAVGSFLLMEPISRWVGADDVLLPDCVLYGRFLMLALPAFLLQNEFQSFLITAERPKLGLWVTVAAGVTNIVLDALFIVVFQWGVKGAAAATGISQLVGGVIPLIYFSRPNNSLLRLGATKLDHKALLSSCTNGLSELVNNISMSLVAILYNLQLIKLAGESGVAAYGAVLYVGFMFIAIFLGYSIGIMPVIGFHYGAQDHKELAGLFRKSNVIITISSLILAALSFLLAEPLAQVFVGDSPDALAMAITAFRYYSLAVLFSAFNIFGSAFFTALNNGVISAAISFLRTLVFQIAGVFILPLFFGLDGVWSSLFVAELLATAVTFLFYKFQRSKYHF